MATIAAHEAEELKKQGNKAFADKDYEKAVEFYSQALDKDFTMTILLNRSEAYLKLGR